MIRKISLCVILLSSSTVIAEETRGRLPDGRPFRTDIEGNQVVDYIAELELAVENLTRQTQGLEYEVQQKQNAIDSLNGNITQLKEKNIIAEQPKVQEVKCDTTNEEQLATELSDIKEQYEQCRSNLKDKDSQIASIIQEVDESKKKSNDLQKELIESKSQQAKQEVAVLNNSKASFSPLRMAAMGSIRDELKNKIAYIEKQGGVRDSLYAEYTKSPRVVEFKPASLTTSQGKSLNQLRKAVDDASAARELSVLTKEIDLLKSKVDGDIGLMTRMKRLGQ